MSIETSLAWLDNLSAPGGWQSSSAYLPALVLFFVFVVVLSLPLLARFVYWTLIYPYHTSPLRHLPGPKVRCCSLTPSRPMSRRLDNPGTEGLPRFLMSRASC